MKETIGPAQRGLVPNCVLVAQLAADLCECTTEVILRVGTQQAASCRFR